MQFLPDAAYPNEGDTVQAVASAVTHVAVALDELKDQLEIANRRVGEVAAAQITEAELGRLFVRAAQFADAAIAEAEEEARQAVTAASREAERILADARIEANAIIDEAKRSTALGAAAAQKVQSTIEGFTRVNQELIRELDYLRDIIQPELAAGTAPPLPAVTAGTADLPTPLSDTAAAAPTTDPTPPWAATNPPAWRDEE